MRLAYESPMLIQVGSFAKSTGYLWARKDADPITGWKDMS